MGTGKHFSASDEDAKGRAPKASRQSRRELEKLKSEFMDRARHFIDDTAIGEGRKTLQKFIQKVKGENLDEGDESQSETSDELATALTAYAEVPETADPDWDADEDADWDEPADPEAELDWSRPEYIRAGYAKPGTVYEKPRSLEEAQEESMNLRFGNLSNLLGRFGSEDAQPEVQVTGVKLEMDKAHFQQQMQKIHILLEAQAGMSLAPTCWLYPEVLTLLRAGNSLQRVLLFLMAAFFAQTPENYLTQSDQAWIQELMQRAGFLMEPELIQRQVEQTFLFPERVHRLYQSLLEEPVILQAEAFENYQQNLAKLYISSLASRYGAEPQNVIRTLAAKWQEQAQGLQVAYQAVQPIKEQYARFQERKLNSASLFQKLRQAEAQVLAHYEQMQAIAREIEALKQVTHLIEEEDALARLQQFQTQLVLDAHEQLGQQAISLLDLRQRFVQAQLDSFQQIKRVRSVPSVELSPLEQKRAIGRAKEGELKSMLLIQAYKNWRISQFTDQTLTHEPAPASAPGPVSDHTPEGESA